MDAVSGAQLSLHMSALALSREEFLEHCTGATISMELFPGSTLQHEVEKAPPGKFCARAACHIFHALLEAMQYIHRRSVVHRDVTTTNVLVSSDLKDVRLIDFGISHRLDIDGEMLDMRGTTDFLAPEVLLGMSVGSPCDIWGAGLCLFVMASGRLPVKSRDFSSQRCFAEAMLDAVATPDGAMQWSGLPSCVQRALGRCLDAAPDVRATADEALSALTLS